MNSVHHDNAIAPDWYRQLTPTPHFMPSRAPSAWMEQIRLEAHNAALRLGFPNRKQEAWRYSNVQRVLENHQANRDEVKKNVKTSDLAQSVAQSRISDLDSYRIVFAQNKYSPQLSNSTQLPPGIEVLSLSQAIKHSPELVQQYLSRIADYKNDVFVALNTALLSDGLIVKVDENIEIDKPLEIIFFSSTQSESSAPRLLIVLEENARVTVVERFVATTTSFDFHNVVEEIFLGKHARLTHYRLVEEAETACHISNINIRQSENSHFQSYHQDISGAWLRSNYNVDLQGRDAVCRLQGLCILDGKQQCNIHTNIQHRVGACKSEQNFKSILLGVSRAVFDGKIIVDRDAQATDAHLKNHNLLLSDKAEVDTKPQLEIYADNVKCGHGTTVGQVDPEQLYYLRSRGIMASEAYRLLCDGFAADVMQACDIDPLRQYMVASMSRTLDKGLIHSNGAQT